MTAKSPNTDKPTRTGIITAPDTTDRATNHATHQAADHTFEMRFSSTPRGARLARRLAAVRLDAWGIPYDTDAHDAIVLIVAELAANAARHGRVPGRDFHLRLAAPPNSVTVRVEVTDTRAEHLPRRPVLTGDPSEEETGRGLLLVSALAIDWGWHAREDGPGKTVWAECTTTPATAGETLPPEISATAPTASPGS